MPNSQADFRRRRGTLDNVYVLNYLINRQVTRKEGRLVILFVGFKAAFNTVNKEIFIETLRKRGGRD